MKKTPIFFVMLYLMTPILFAEPTVTSYDPQGNKTAVESAEGSTLSTQEGWITIKADEMAVMDGQGGIESIIKGPKELAIYDNGKITGYNLGPGYIELDAKRVKKMEVTKKGDFLFYEKGKLVKVRKKDATYTKDSQGNITGSERTAKNGKVEKFDLLGKPLK